MLKFSDVFAKYGLSSAKFEPQNLTVFMGTFIEKENAKAIENLQKNTKKIIFLSPLECNNLKEKIVKSARYEVGSETGVLALLAKTAATLQNWSLSNEEKEYFERLDDGYLSAESNVGEEEIEEILNLLQNENIAFVLGDDIADHPNLDTIIGLIAFISRHKKIAVNLLNEKEIKSEKSSILPSPIEELSSFDGTVVYFYPSSQNEFEGSPQFAVAAKIQNNEGVTITDKNGTKYERVFKIDEKLKGTIAILGSNEHKGFRYEVAKIMKRQ